MCLINIIRNLLLRNINFAKELQNCPKQQLGFSEVVKKILLHKILEKLMLGFLMFISVFSQPDARKITIR